MEISGLRLKLFIRKPAESERSGRAAPRTVRLLCPFHDGGAGHSGDGSSSICSVGTLGEEALSGTTLIYSSISPSFRKAAPGNMEDKLT